MWPALLVLTATVAYARRYALLAFIGATSVAAPFVVQHGVLVAPYVHIVLGCSAALLLHRRRTYELLRVLGGGAALAGLAAAFLAWQFLVPGTGVTGDLYAPYGIFVCLLLIGLVTTTTPAIRWLWSRPMVTTATLSYALYLVHNFGLNFAESALPGGYGLPGSLASTAFGLALAYAFAYLLNGAVEQPCIALGRRITARRRAEAPVLALPEQAPQLP